MPDSLANKFITALDPARDHLYTLALAKESTPAKAESVLQKSVRELFPHYAKDPYLNIPATLEQQLTTDNSALITVPMPADVWARLAAAIQLEAAKSASKTGTGGGGGLNPDSVLLNPDPLLAPKKSSAPDDDDLSPPSRFLLASAIALLIGIALTIYILTRPSTPHPTTQPTTTPTTQASHG